MGVSRTDVFRSGVPRAPAACAIAAWAIAACATAGCSAPTAGDASADRPTAFDGAFDAFDATVVDATVDAGGRGDTGDRVDVPTLDVPTIDMPTIDVPTDGSSADGTPPADAGSCVRARRLWFDDFETGDYSRWTSRGYDRGWNMGLCHDNGFSTAQAVSPTRSHRSVITCASGMSVHRGYGGMQFSGDTPLAGYTNRGVGIDAPHGVVNTYWSHLDVPYAFGGGRWFSFWTVNGSCDWSEQVVTLGLEDASNRLTPAHILSTGGTVTFEPGAPGFPLRRWVRTTLYVNYHTGRLHVWQDGRSLLDARFTRASRAICQWHWGAYTSGDNTSVTLYEDDLSIWRLDEPWTDFAREPHFERSVRVCP